MCHYVNYVCYPDAAVWTSCGKEKLLGSLCFKSLNIKALEFRNPNKLIDVT
jgi:hypothetical protein